MVQHDISHGNTVR